MKPIVPIGIAAPKYIEDTPKIEYSNMEYLKLFMKEIRKNNFSRTEE